MSQINIQTINDTLVVDSRLIAQELGIEHKSLKKNIRSYGADLEELGSVALSVAPSNANGGGGSGESFYYLNEDQATYLMTLSDNTPQVRAAKLHLVKAFSVAKKALQAIVQPQQPQLPENYLDALKALVAVEEEKQALALVAAEQEAVIAALEPKAEVYDALANSNKNLTMQEAAKVIGILGRNKLFNYLRLEGILQGDNLPYQQYINSGYFEVIEKPGRNIVDTFLVTLVTQKGIEFIFRKLQASGYAIKSAA